MNLPLLILGGLGLAGAYVGFKKKDPTINVSSCFFDRLAIPLYTFFNEYHSNSNFLVDYIQDDCIICNTFYDKLYGIEINSNSTIVQYLDNTCIERLFRDFKKNDDAFFYYCLLKQDRYQKQYIFSHNKTLVQTIGTFFNANLLSGNELINAIYNLYLQNSYYVKDKQIKPSIILEKDQLKIEPEFMGFKRLIRESILKNLNEVDLFQAYKSLNINQTQIQELFRQNFNGAIWFYFDISKTSIEKNIQKQINHAKWVSNKKPFVELKKAYDNGEINLILINSIMMLKKYEEQTIGSIGSFLKINYLYKNLYKTKQYNSMPFKYKDENFDFLVKDNYLHNFISAVHKKHTKNPDIYGFDKNGSFINYSFSEENDDPHFVIIAKPGSGKSVTKQKIMSLMIGLDFKTGKCNNLGSKPNQVKIRSYDIGFSDENFINLIKGNTENNVAHISSNFNDFSYNLVNINEKSNEEEFKADLDFMGNLANLILATQNASTLSIDELGNFKLSVKNIYSKKEYDKKRIGFLKNTNLSLFEELINLGYKESNYFDDIKEEKYQFLQKPMLKDIIKYTALQSENRQIKEEEREQYASLTNKLKSIDNLEIFSKYDQTNINDVDVLSMDLNNFKESSLFVPIFFCIFQKTYLKDREFALKCKREKRSAPKLVYAIEEAKNYFRGQTKELEMIFDKVILEARKYNVHFGFIAQNSEHIPFSILKNIGTRMFLLRPDKKREVIQEATEVFNIPENVKIALDNTQSYEICCWYSKGVFNMKLDISEEEMEVFNTNPNELVAKKLPYGRRKTDVVQ